MASIVGLWPIKLINYQAIIVCAVLIFCLFPLSAIAQEPEEEIDLAITSSEANSSSQSSEAPLYPSRDMRNKSLFADATTDDARWLDTEYGKIPALYRPTEAKKTLGVLVLFHSAENPQFWPPALENLRANLPRYGWETLAISLPHKYPTTIPERPNPSSFSASASSSAKGDGGTPEQPEIQEEAVASSTSTSSSSSATSSSSSIARDLLINAYINAAFDFLKENTQFNVVVLADNSSAYQVLQNLTPQIKENKQDSTTIDGPLQALVITNLQQQEPITRAELEGIFTTKELPILDIFFAPGNTEQRASRDLHRAVAMRNKLAEYHQLLTDTPSKLTEQDHQSYLLGRVRGFMKQKASGSEFTSKSNETTNTQQ